jgi:hypothetical protein
MKLVPPLVLACISLWTVSALAVDPPKNSKLEIRLNEVLSSDTCKPGQKFAAILNRDVSIGNHMKIEKGSSVEGIVKNAKPTYGFQKPGELDLELASVKSGGKIYSVRTNVLVLGGKAENDPSNAHPLDNDRPPRGVVRGEIGGVTIGNTGVTQTIPGTNVSTGSESERTRLEVRLPQNFKLSFKLEWISEGKDPD